jgi:Tfp pilus assembly protein PilN
MIRINLIAEKKKKAGKSKAAAGAGPAGMGGLKLEGLSGGRNLLLIAVLAGGAAVAGGWWWMLKNETADWQAKLTEADQEIKRLEAAIKKGEEYEAQKALLARKIELITNLKKQQAVPVHILDKVSRSLPDFVWLDTMSAAHDQISISGKATTYNAVSNFYANLNDSGYFKNVTLGRTFEVPEGVSFSLTCQFASQVLTDAAAQS